MSILQFLGLFISAFILLFIYGWSMVECNKGNGEKLTPAWVRIVMLLTCLVLGFTIGTLIP